MDIVNTTLVKYILHGVIFYEDGDNMEDGLQI